MRERDFGGAGGTDLHREAETLATFKKRIDEMLAKLEKSPAAQSKIGDQKISKDAYGTGFGAAEDLAGLYEKVHTRLEVLSRTFGEQLEALGITVQISDRGYQGIDAEQAARLRAIQQRTDKYYREPGAERGERQGEDRPAGTGGEADEAY